MSNLDPELVENYRTLSEETGEPLDSIVRRVEAVDASTAGKLREEFAGKRSAAPVDRQAPAKDTVDAAPAPKRPAKKAAKKAAPRA